MNYIEMKDGFPDLMRLWDGALSFIEVKAPGDVLRRNQLTRIRQMRDAGFDVEIANILWDVDPEQIYVVVDIETTGGGKSNHRITEIGALKVQERLEPGAVVATVFSDDNKKYLSTDLAGAEPVRAGYIAPEIELIGFQSIPFTS